MPFTGSRGVGCIFGGGAANIGFARSGDNRATWTGGFLPATTAVATPPGPYSAVSDPAVAFDARHNVWLISSLAIPASGSRRVLTSRSSDGGQTWGPARNTGDNATGIGGQPLVRPNGTVLVPINSANQTQIRSFRSINGGASWRATVLVPSVSRHTVAGGLRTSPLPSAEMDAAGTAYVVWQDCRFRSGGANDIVLYRSTSETTWGPVTRVPIDATSSGVDHFIPGIGVDRSRSGASARIGLTYYYYPNASCSLATCQLNIGYVSSVNGGANWSAATNVAGPMQLGWLANTSQGRMVGEYISTSVLAGGRAWQTLAVAGAPSGGLFHEAMHVPTGGLPVTGGVARASAAGVVVTGPSPAAQLAPAVIRH